MNPFGVARKIRSMPASELAGRVRYTLDRTAERLQHRSTGLAPARRLEASISGVIREDASWREQLLALRRSKRPRFFAGTENRSAMCALFADTYSNERRETERWAERAARHEFHFFGQTFQYGEVIPWHEDPVSHRSWPLALHQSIPHAEGVGAPDVKYVWELSRHQFVLDLGKAYFLTGRVEYAASMRALVLQWIDANPYGLGVNWASPLEPAYRSLAWLWAYWFTVDDPSMDAASHARWVEGFYDAGRFLHRHMELYASPYNHLLGEACALYAIGVAFPEFREAERWQAAGRAVLVDRLSQQFYADGGTVEQATCYHHASLGFYLLAALLGRANGDDFPRPVWTAIERAIEFSIAIMQPDGSVPMIGDTDDARPIWLERGNLWDFRAFAAAGAVLFGRGDFKSAAGRFHEDALWLLGQEGLQAFDALPATAPPASVSLGHSGYAVMRSDRPTGDFVLFDCGEQAGGLRHDAVPNAAHGHADCLSVVVWLGGRPFLVDSGFFTYNSDREWERYFRETAAHNTVRVDRRDQAVHLDKMAWMRVPRATPEMWQSDAAGTVAAGSHDGYAQGPDGVIHRRMVWLRPGGYVVIRDELLGNGAHHMDLNFQCAPMNGALVEQSFRSSDGFELRVFAPQPLQGSLAHGQPAPSGGWVASGLGVRHAAPKATFETSFAAPGLVVMSIAADTQRVRLAAVPSDPLAAIVTGPDFTDVVQAAPLGGTGGDAVPRTTEPPGSRTQPTLDTDAALAICRVHNGLVASSDSAGGTYVHVEPERLRRVLDRDLTFVE